MTPSARRPIGVFDSGLGGLTVVRELQRRLPGEDIVYVGDTARVPYGNKSPETIRRYALQIAFFLLQKQVKSIVVACNTVSALALKSLSSLPLPVIGVIEPGARAAVLKTSRLRLGVIGTNATVSSHAYRRAIQRYAPKATVVEQACPLFVPLVEEGWESHPVTREVAQSYLKPLLKSRIDTLVLGCTHYPLLKETLGGVAGPSIRLIDSAEETAKDVQSILRKTNLLNPASANGKTTFYVTDHASTFSRLSRQFLGKTTSNARRLSLDAL